MAFLSYLGFNWQMAILNDFIIFPLIFNQVDRTGPLLHNRLDIPSHLVYLQTLFQVLICYQDLLPLHRKCIRNLFIYILFIYSKSNYFLIYIRVPHTKTSTCHDIIVVALLIWKVRSPVSSQVDHEISIYEGLYWLLLVPFKASISN